MNSEKEKLVSLIEQKQVYGIDQEQPHKRDLQLIDNEELADHLIANDVVPVVRCKNCVYYQPIGSQYSYKGRHAMHCIWHQQLTKEDGYCDGAIRKGADDE